MVKVLRLGAILALFCVISAGGLAYVYLFTQPRIELNARLNRESAEKAVLPADGQGRALLLKPTGYSGKIEMLVGIAPDGKVSGVNILNQTETPGLGANVTQPWFLKQFIGKTASDPLESKKDIDAISGATISSRAVCRGVRQALTGEEK